MLGILLPALLILYFRSSLPPMYRQLLTLLHLGSRPVIHHHASPFQLTTLDPSGSLDAKKRVTTLAEILAACPSLQWYSPTTWLASGHAATIYCTLPSKDTLVYGRQYLQVPDGGVVGLDFAPPITAEDPLDKRPILMVLHGLTGGSHESYVISVLKEVTKSKEEGGLGWRGCVVNFRGCAGTPIKTKQLYHGGYSDDLRCALAYISHHAPSVPLYGIGFSLGANILAKYLGEEGPLTPLKTGIVLGCPWDFVQGHVYLSSTMLRQVYSRAMASNLRKLVWRHREMLKDDPRIDWDALYGNPHQTLYEFDALVTAPLAGYRSAHAYYRGVESVSTASSIAVPTLSISALDDPIVAGQTVPIHIAEQNPNLVFATTKHGGHLGWWEGLFRPTRWVAKPVLEWFAAFEAADGEPRRHKELKQVGEGWVDAEREQIGFVELEGGGVEVAHVDDGEGEQLTRGL